MATDLGEVTIKIKKQVRTWRTEIESPLGEVPSVTAYCETVRTGDDGDVTRTQGIQVRRSFADLANDSVKVGDKTYTAVEVAAAIPAFIDKWRAEDIEAAQGSKT